MSNDNYAIGLDIGTNSVGWAVVNEDSSIGKFRKKSMFGTRKSNPVQTAEVRRLYRTTRRRKNRIKYRIDLLQELLSPEMMMVDPGFYIRMKESFVKSDDKTYNLFIDKSYTDLQYHKDYPTIYHLRNELMSTKSKKDIRLIYLAIHHILKNRGHFLYEGRTFNVQDSSMISESLDTILKKFNIDDLIIDEIAVILKEDSTNRGTKKELLQQLLLTYASDKSEENYIKEIINGILGYKFKLSVLYPEISLGDHASLYIYDIFNDEKVDIQEALLSTLTDDEFVLFGELQNVYSWHLMQAVLSGEPSLSLAKIKAFEEHKKELKDLKMILKKYDLKNYNLFFRTISTKRANSTNQGTKANNKNYDTYLDKTSQFDIEAMNKHLASILKVLNVSQEDQIIKDELIKKTDERVLLIKQNNKSNSIIPYQVHMIELKAILENQGQHYPLLKDNKDKLEMLLSFRIPYFVGPLNTKSEFSTAVRYPQTGNTYEKVTPWNFNSLINLEASAEKFIQVRTNKCTYLPGEDVLPKKSILYQNYEVLNELNGIRIDGHRLHPSTKKEIFDELFLNKLKISEKDLRVFLLKKCSITAIENAEITGFQKENEFSTNRSSAIFFRKYFDIIKDSEMIEKLISWNTMIKDKNILQSKIRKEFPELDDHVVEAIRKQNLDGWGRLSATLLDGIKSSDEGETILEIMTHSQSVFMEVLHNSKHGFLEKIESYQGEGIKPGKIPYEVIQDLACSPSVKAQIWQSVKIVEELVSIKKTNPKQIFIEFARSADTKKRSTSRQKYLNEIYQSIKKEDKYFPLPADFEPLKTKSDHDLQSIRVFLYYIQKGKCLYTGETLKFEALSHYQIDHIIPQSIVKNNSIDNLALVKTFENQMKEDKIGLSPEIINKMTPFWYHLTKLGLMGKSKFHQLSRIYNEDEKLRTIEGFINRQLVETRQITKHTVAILKAAYPDSEVISIKARTVGLLRDNFQFPKTRTINDFHHAKDAYLVAVMGQFLTARFPWIYNNSSRKPRMNYEYHEGKNGYIVNQFLNNFDEDKYRTTTWNGIDRLSTIHKVMKQNDVIITHKLVEESGEFYDQTLYSPHDGNKKLIPVNSHNRSDVNKYGGFSSVKPAYSIIIEETKTMRTKSVTSKRLINLPILYKGHIEEYLEVYKKSNGLDTVSLIRDKILLNQLVIVKGEIVRLSSATEWSNAQPLILSYQSETVIEQIDKGLSPSKFIRKDLQNVITEYQTKVQQHYPHFSGYSEKLSANLSKILDFNNYDLVEIIKLMLIVTTTSAQRAAINIAGVNLGSSCGRMTGKNLDVNSAAFVHESITGLFTNVEKL